MKFTHVKRPYHACCMIWDGTNTPMVIHQLHLHGCEAHAYGDQLMLRWKDDFRKPSLEMMSLGAVLRIGENGVMKVMSPEEFALKYEPI